MWEDRCVRGDVGLKGHRRHRATISFVASLRESLNMPMYSGLESDAKFSESLEGLRVIQLVRPTVFNFVLPKLLKTPMPLNSIRYTAGVYVDSIATLHIFAHVWAEPVGFCTP